jgi:hypothetical protein
MGLLFALFWVSSMYATLRVSRHFVTWDQEVVSLGPQVPSSLVVLFRRKATPQEIGRFVTNTVSRPDPRGGHAHLPGMRSLASIRVGKHEGYALQLDASIRPEDREFLLGRVRDSAIVWKVFENVAPNDIVLREVDEVD